MTKKENIEKFLKTVKDDSGNWLEEARYRRKNRAWLRKSQRIAIRVLSTLRERGMQQKELAEQLNVSPQQVSKIVKGKENLTLETISKLEQVLDITLFEVPEYHTEIEVPANPPQSLNVTDRETTRFKANMKWSKLQKQQWNQSESTEEPFQKAS